MIPQNIAKPDTILFKSDKKRKIVLEQKKGVKYIGHNESNTSYTCYMLDKIMSNDLACDYLLCADINQCNKSYFIELKGSDIIHAVEQIDNSISHFQTYISQYSVNGRIILSRINTIELKNVKYLKLKKRIESLGGSLIQKTRQLEEKI